MLLNIIFSIIYVISNANKLFFLFIIIRLPYICTVAWWHPVSVTHARNFDI